MPFDRTRLITCIGVEHDLGMLPHFLAHYRALGLAPEQIHPILNAAHAASPALDRATALLTRAGVAPADIWIAPYTSETMWERRRSLQTRLCNPDDWVISADLDEFHGYPEPLPAFLDRCEAMGVDCVQGPFIDRLAPGGRLAPVRAGPALADQFPVAAEVALSIAGKGVWHDLRGTVKIMAARAAILPGRGGHRPWKGQRAQYLYGYPLGDLPKVETPAFRFALPTRVHHYHWTETLPDRLRLRLDTPGVSKAGAEYGAKQLDHIAAHGGISLDHVAVCPDDPAGNWVEDIARLRRAGRWRSWRDRLLLRAAA